MTPSMCWNALRSGVLGLCFAAALVAAYGDDEAAAAMPDVIQIIWTGQAYVGVGNQHIYTSADGATWKKIHDSEDNVLCVASGNGRVVVGGFHRISVANGLGPELTFSSTVVPEAAFLAVSFANGTFVAVAGNGSAYVGDGIEPWKVVPVGAVDLLNDVAYGNGTWVALAGINGLYTAKNPSGPWTRATIPDGLGNLGDVTFGHGGFVVGTEAGHVLESADGVTWRDSDALTKLTDQEISSLAIDNLATYVIGRRSFRRPHGGEWSALPASEYYGWRMPVVRDGTLHVVVEGPANQFVSIDDAIVLTKKLVAEEATNSSATVAAASLDLTGEKPVRLTAFDGANVNRLAAGADALYAATSKGLFKSSDGQTWEPFGGVTTPVDFVAVTRGGVVIATKDGLSQLAEGETSFSPVEHGQFKIRDLRASASVVAAIGEGAKLFVRDADGTWRDIVLDGATTIHALVASDEICQVVADTRAGLRQFYVSANNASSYWTPLRGVKIAAITENGAALFESPAGAVLGAIPGNGTARHVDLPGRATDLIPGWLVTSRGLIAGVSSDGDSLWPLYTEEGAALTTIVDAGSSVVAAGLNGVVIIAPKPGENAAEPKTFPSVAVDFTPKDFGLPAGVQIHVIEALGEIARVKSDAGKIYGVKTSGDLVAWHENDWGGDVFSAAYSDNIRDAVVVGDTVAAINSSRLFQAPLESRSSNAVSWGRSTDEDLGYRRIFHGGDSFLLLANDADAGIGTTLSSLNPRRIASAKTLRDAAWGRGVWVIVGANGDDGHAPAVYFGAGDSGFTAAAIPLREGSLYAVTFDGRRFVAVGDRGNVLSSTDGTTWQAFSIEGAPALREIAFGANQYGVVTDENAILVSNDLATWRELPRDPQFVFSHIAGTTDTLWAIGEHAALGTQAKVEAWKNQPTLVAREFKAGDMVEHVTALTASKVADGRNIFDIAWDGTRFVACANEGLWASMDGRAFSKVRDLSSTDNGTVQMAFGKLWLRTEGNLFSCAPGENDLSIAQTLSSGDPLVDFAANETTLVLVSTRGAIHVTEDRGATWREAPRTGLAKLNRVAWAGSRWIVAGTSESGDTAVAISTDLQAWKLVAIPDHTGGFTSLSFGNGHLVASGGTPWAIAVSSNGEQWNTLQLDGIDYATTGFADGKFYLARYDRVYVSQDGLAWRDLGVKPRGSIDRIASAFGTLYLVGGENDGVNFARVPIATEAQFAAAVEKTFHPLQGMAEKIIAWDLAMTAATSSDERLKLCRDLCRAWRDSHSGYTKESALAFIDGMYDRVLKYQTNDHTISDFVLNLGDFSSQFMRDFMDTLPPEHRSILKQIAADIAADYNAKNGGPASNHPARAQARVTPVLPQRDVPWTDIDQLRLRAARGDKLAAYDLSYSYGHGIGVPIDLGASVYWSARARRAGLVIPENASAAPADRLAAWKQLAEQGSAIAQNLVGEYYRDGTGTDVDYAEANRWFKLAAADGNWGASVNLARAYRDGKGVACDPDAAMKLLEQASAPGSALALAEIGWTYEAGAGVKRDLSKALDYYQRAADAHFFWAARRVAEFYFAGYGVAKDETKARAFFQKCADAGDTDAKTILADLAAGKHQAVPLASYVPPKPGRSIFDVATRRAKAETGDAAACYDMAYITWNGYGVVADKTLGDQWLAKAKAKSWKQPDKWDGTENAIASWRTLADQGSIVALYQLGKHLASHGDDADVAASIALFRQAAEAGEFQAQAEMGKIYEFSRGDVAADKAQSFSWYLRAADGGNAFAQSKTGFNYDMGRGVAQDPVAAFRYFQLGAEGGDALAAANLAAKLATGSGVTADPKAAAGWYLELAQLPNVPTDPAAAYAQIKAEVEGGKIVALGPLAIMTKRGFGAAADNNEAWALAYAAEYFESNIYVFDWFQEGRVGTPADLRRASQLVANGWKHSFGELGQTEAEGKQAQEQLNTAQEKESDAAKDAEKSEVARALRALAAGNATDELINAATQSTEPLRIYGLAGLREKTAANKYPENQPWMLRLAGVTDAKDDDAAVEQAFVNAAVATPDFDDREAIERTIALRAIETARLYYGIGITADAPAALAWAMFNEQATDEYLPIVFLADQLSAAELARADARYLGLRAESQQHFVDGIDRSAEADTWKAAAKLYRDDLQQAADAGDIPSLHQLAALFESGDYDFGKDPAQSYAAHLKAAQLGDIESMFRAGHTLAYGAGITKDEAAGKVWLEKAAKAGHARASTTLAELAAADARAALRTPPDKKTGAVDATVFQTLSDLQNDTATTTLGEPALGALLKAVWWDADYSPVEEDLARELRDASARPLVVTSVDGRTLTFTKTVDATVAEVFPQYLQGEFNVLNGEYYKQVWAKTVNAGVFLGGCHVNDNGRTFMRGFLAQNIFDGVKFTANQGGQSFDAIFGALKTAHDDANPALQAEFRREISEAIKLIEQQGIYSVPDTYKNAAWLKAATP